jgi:hypothetical protein
MSEPRMRQIEVGGANGFTVELPEGWEIVTTAELRRGRAASQLLSDLDRNADGRHKGETSFGDPTGVSHGNPLLPPGSHVGYGLDGILIVVPEIRGSSPADWYQRPEKDA